jgi:beta-N-acetylhexosaminidase
MTDQAPVVIDIAGTTLTDADRRRITHPLAGGLILFARNGIDRAQLVRLTAEIKSLRPDMLIAVDHEGGRVQRFRNDGFTHLPTMRTLGRMWRQPKHPTRGADGDAAMQAMQAATACGLVLGAELRACGIDFSFTPVLDLDHGTSAVIGDRAFDRDPRVVAMLARALAEGLLRMGMASCGKHFPGHGYAAADSHTDVPIDKRSRRALLADDVLPYAWLSASLTSVMPAHVIYPKVDSRPAGFSPVWLREILRAQLGFQGAIFSDDLSMQGARVIDGREVSATEAAIEALRAGCDMVLLCNQSLGDGSALDALLDGLTDARAGGRWQPDAASEERRLALLPTTPPLPWDELMRHPAYLDALDRIP